MRKLKRVVVKEELVALTGDIIRALILNQFLYWTERVQDFDKFIEEEKERMSIEKEGEYSFPIEKRHGWIYKSAEELAKEIMLNKHKTTVLRHIDFLVKNGWVEKRRNPRFKWDKTFQYRVNFKKLKEDLEKIGYSLQEWIDDSKLKIFKSNSTSELHFATLNSQKATAIPEITTEITDNNKLYNIAENSACVCENLKNEEKEKNATLNDQSEKLTREISAADGENEKAQKFFGTPEKEKKKKKGEKEQNPKLKELKKIISKIYAKKYRQIVGVDYPSKDWGKLMKLSKKAAEFFLHQIEKGETTPQEAIFRVLALVNFAFERKKIDPVWIFGKVAEAYAELKTYYNDETPFYKKVAEKALSEAKNEIDDYLSLAQDFINLFNETV